ncbi:hypothetical protein [Enorma sp.]|uniref:hypothetical protein n=1 Tax=Enorma sp. TaxID=1920692 RepID=UPI003AB7185D
MLRQGKLFLAEETAEHIAETLGDAAEVELRRSRPIPGTTLSLHMATPTFSPARPVEKGAWRKTSALCKGGALPPI